MKMYSKRDGAKLMKEVGGHRCLTQWEWANHHQYEHAKDPSLVEVAADQRCNRCMRNQWRCFIEADPNSPRRVCRPCGKNKCSFGNAKARPQVIAPLPKQSPDPYPKQEPLEHNPHLAPSHLPYHHPSPVAWQSYPLHPGASSAVQHDRMLDRPAHRESFRPFNFHGRSHHEPRMSIPHPPVQVQVEHRARSQTHSQASQSPPPSLVESPPSPSAHIYRRGSHCTQSSAASPRTPPEEVSHEWSRSRMLSVSDAAAPAYNAVPQIPREQSLAAIRGLMATTREMMGRLAELEAQLVRQ